MKRFALIAAIAAGLAAPAFAQTETGPIYDVTFSDRSSTPLAEALLRLNADQDRVGERHATATTTLSTPRFGAAIFDRIRAEND